MANEIRVNENKSSSKPMSQKTRRIIYIAFIFVVILVLVGVNILANVLVKKNPSLEIDLTSNKAYSLQDTTLEYLNYVDGNIKITVLMTEDSLVELDGTFGYQVNQLLRDMSVKGNITLEYLETEMLSVNELSKKYPKIDWAKLEELLIVESEKTGKYTGITMTDVFMYSYDDTGETVIVGQNVEKEILGAIQKVTADKVIKAAISIGNGEYLNPESDGYYRVSNFLSTLENNAYELENVNLMTQEVPEDAELLVMLGSTTDLTAEAADSLTAWLSNNGNMGKTLLYVPVYSETVPTNINLILEQWSMKMIDGLVFEEDSNYLNTGGSGFYPIYADEEYTENLRDASVPVIMANGTSWAVEITDESVATSLLTTSDSARVLLRESLEKNEEIYKEAKEGGYSVATLSTKRGNSDTASNIIVWGSLGSFDSEIFSVYNNENYIINLLNTLCENKVSEIVMSGVPLGGNQMVVTEANNIAFRIVFVIIVPILLVSLGVVVWVRRKNR